MKTFLVNIKFDGEFWIIHVPEIDRVTQALKYRDIPTAATELIALSQELENEEIHLIVREDGTAT